jgi:DNA-directed RNA polymerase subunit RPC12/RpoP
MILAEYIDQRAERISRCRWLLLLPAGIWGFAPPYYSVLALPVAVVILLTIRYALRNPPCPRCHHRIRGIYGEYSPVQMFGETIAHDLVKECPHCGLRLDEEIRTKAL